MKTILKCTTILAGLGLSIGLLPGVSVAENPSSTVITSPVSDGLAIGDRLKITVFEIMGQQAGPESCAQ